MQTGFNIETVSYRNINFTVWDVGGGGGNIYHLWSNYFNLNESNQALLYVVDSTDRERIGETSEILQFVLSGKSLQELKSLLILANKQDLPDAMSAAEIRDRMKLDQIIRKDIKWNVIGTSGTTGDGLYEAFDWVISNKDVGRG